MLLKEIISHYLVKILVTLMLKSYQWVNDSDGMALTEETITPPLAYTITNIQREASGNYSCVLTDDDYS